MGSSWCAGLDGRRKFRGAGRRDTTQWRRAGVPRQDLRRDDGLSVRVGRCAGAEARERRHYCYHHGGVPRARRHWRRGGDVESLARQDGSAGGARVCDVPKLRVDKAGDAHQRHAHVFKVHRADCRYGHWHCGGGDRVFVVGGREPGLEGPPVVRGNIDGSVGVGPGSLRRAVGLRWLG